MTTEHMFGSFFMCKNTDWFEKSLKLFLNYHTTKKNFA